MTHVDRLGEVSADESEGWEIPAAGISRRRFLTLLGASAALASTNVSCSKIDRGTIVPYTNKPDDVLPGVANYYASTFQEGLNAYGVLVKTREGRPIHIEGNHEHPHFKGKTSLRAVADVLRLYDPDRLRQPLIDGRPAAWKEAEGRLLTALREARDSGKVVILMTGAVISPTRRAVIASLKKVLPGLLHVPFETLGPEAERAAARAVFGETRDARPRFDRANVVVSFHNDFLGVDGNVPAATREFAEKRRVRRPGDSMSRLWMLESRMSLTGTNADERIAIKPSNAAATAFALARHLHEKHGIPTPPGLDSAVLSGFDLDRIAHDLGIEAERLGALAADMAKARRTALVIAGPALPTEAHVAVALLNVMLGAEGHTVDAAFAPRPVEIYSLAALRERLQDLLGRRPGTVGAAIFWDVNPAYTFPDAATWRSITSRIPLRVSIGIHHDETVRDCQLALAENHWLESWGDYEPSTDLVSLQQPTIGPLYNTKQGEQVLLEMVRDLGGTTQVDYRGFMKQRWREEVFPGGSVPFERFWNAALHDGVWRRPAKRGRSRVLRPEVVVTAAARVVASRPEGLELTLHAGATVYDGRYANIGWLQELPDPVTKATWSNPVSVSSADAERLHLSDGDVVKIGAGSRYVEAPVIVQPGQATSTIAASLGYGRRAPSVARNVGVNFYPLLDETSATPTLRTGVTIARVGRREALPFTQQHHSMEGRDIVRSVSLSKYGAAGATGKQRQDEELPSLYPEQHCAEHKWGMVIDLAACVGCGGCTVACQSENNIPVVGPEQVLKGREMHWIRVDRYYDGDASALRVVHQPMLCQQCDNAPCETVCPVNATNHSPDGLNQMVYNRCIGTRYCANNCPYKVRRFNFLDFTGTMKEPESLAYNPEVTVRPRGVMEKCTFCVQRIQEARERAKSEGRAVRDGEITPACAAACPTQAIVFGDLKDPDSTVSRGSANDRGYKVLAELGVKPSVTYLTNIVNTAEPEGSHET